jgi:hypothetical protein
MVNRYQKRRCTATTHLGKPCRCWAMVGYDVCRDHRTDLNPPSSGPPGNQHTRIHGLYSRFINEDDLAALAQVSSSDILDDEIAFTRVVIMRLAALVEEADGPRESIRLAEALFTGTGRVANLLRARRAISGDAAEGMAGAISQALDELSSEWGVEL